jgi:hypothetical protein
MIGMLLKACDIVHDLERQRLALKKFRWSTRLQGVRCNQIACVSHHLVSLGTSYMPIRSAIPMQL